MSGFLGQAFVYLGAAVVAVPIAKKLGLGSVLGYLLAGVAIGPFGLGLVGEEGQDVMHYAEFGVVMMLFLVGLELEAALLWRLRAPILGLGGLQVAVTSLLLAVIATLFGVSFPTGLAIGLTLSMSSTAIVIQMLNEKGWMKTAAGQSSFAVLLFQDLAVIPILAIFPLLAPEAVEKVVTGGHEGWVDSLPAWGKTLAVLGAVAGIVLLGRVLVRPALRTVAGTRLRELFTAAALLLVVGIALLMEQVGLSPALGTFLAGVVLADSEYRHELESDIDPFKGLLLGLFFIAVGSSIDFAMVGRMPGLIAGIVAIVFVAKATVLFGLARLFKLGIDQSALFAASLPQVGEFAFVLLSFATGLGALTRAQADPLVAVVALTMAVTPLVMFVFERAVMPRVGTKVKDDRPADHVDEENAVIIAGFDRFGNAVGRLLKANGFSATVLDNDSDRVDLLRRMGLRVFYGDPTRHDLLEAAGAGKAKIIILALDDADKNLSMVHTVRKHFPHLSIYARALDRPDAYELMDGGVKHVYRETVDTALRLGVDVLRALGMRGYRATRASRTFLNHDEQALEELAKARKDRASYINVARNKIEDLERLMQSDAEESQLARDEGWDNESLREEVRAIEPAPEPKAG
ncbi:MAG: cation:proton antiporter [Deltaproteobacteria bacterium]|nr:cation:proton antiporter [Deltaproteobacteria bacterium]